MDKGSLIDGIPFLIGIAGPRSNTINRTRVVESLMIALLTAGVTALAAWLFVIPELKTSMAFIQRDLEKLDAQVHALEDTVLDARMAIGDRWTGTNQRNYERNHEARHEKEREEWSRKLDRINGR